MTPEQRQAERVAIRADLLRVARLEGRGEGVAPSLEGYAEHGRFSRSRVAKRMGMSRDQWLPLMKRYALTPAWDSRLVTEKAVAADVRETAYKLGLGMTMPTPDQQREHGRFHPHQVVAALGEGRGWHGAALRLGLTPQGAPRKAMYKKPRRQDIIEDYQRVAALLGYAPGGKGPGNKLYRQHGAFTSMTVEYHFGSWSALVEAAGFQRRLPNGVKQAA